MLDEKIIRQAAEEALNERGAGRRRFAIEPATGAAHADARQIRLFDADVLIGPNFKPFYDMDKGVDLGVRSWNPDQWKIGGGTVWGFVPYDAETNLIFYGTGNPGVWNPELRPGDNKWSAGVFARNADTGEAAWFYQASPHDL